MKEYYKNKVELAERLLVMAKSGFVESMSEYGEKLKHADYDQALKIISEIQLLIQAVDEMKSNLAFAQEQLQAEINKEKGGKES